MHKIIDRNTENGEGSGALQERILRGIEAYHEHGHEIQWIDRDRCKVRSCEHEGRFYLVLFGKDGERCNCADFSRHGNELGACKHTVAALISWAKRVDFAVDKRHDSRQGEYVWDVIETRVGRDRVVGTFAYVGTAYHAVWILRGWHDTEESA